MTINTIIHEPKKRIDVNKLAQKSISQIHYNAENILITEGIDQLDQPIFKNKNPEQIQWVHIIGKKTIDELYALLKPFNIHPLVIEDMLNKNERSKIEEYDDYIFFSSRVFQYVNYKLLSDQIFMIIAPNFIITLQHKPLGIFSHVRERLVSGKGELRKKNTAYLAYALFDSLIDDYFFSFDEFSLRIEMVDDEIFNSDIHESLLLKIHNLKREIVRFGRSLRPLRDCFIQIVRGDFSMFDEESRLFIRDVSDHSIHLVESLNASKENLDNAVGIYLSNQSNTLNIQMRILTVVTIIFMPLTLLVGIYGMNFEHMPELKWQYGYLSILGFMAFIASMLIWIFYKKRWF